MKSPEQEAYGIWKAYIQRMEILPLQWFCQEKDDLNTDVKVVALLYSLALHGHSLHSWYKLNTNFLENETFSYEL